MASNRLVSLDALRGFTIIAMIIVNSPGSWSHVYTPLLHADWHGVTPTDLVFPFFLFIVGVSIALAFSKRIEVREPRSKLSRKVMIRAAKIFAVGIFLNLWPSFDFETIRVAGVLQRIAIVFLVCGILFLNTSWKAQAWVGVSILAGYWAILGMLPVPLDDVGQKALETGQVERSYGRLVEVDVSESGDSSLEASFEPGVNLAAWIDRQILPGRFWENSWDPEGLFSTLPAVATGILGMLIGCLILSIQDVYRRISWVFLVGFALFCSGIAVSWGFPINKNLWSSSFVLLSGGLSSMCLAACILIVDVQGIVKWTKPGIVFGSNAIVTYALSGMLIVVFYQGHFGMNALSVMFMDMAIGIGVASKLASLLYALLYTTVLYGIARLLYSRRIFVRL